MPDETYPEIIITPNLELDCTGLSALQAENMFIIDAAVGDQPSDVMSLFPIADQVVASGPYGLIFSPGGYVQIAPVSFDDLPAASPTYEGTCRPVNDSTVSAWGATITGGGLNHVLAYCDGSVWKVIG